MRRYLLILTVCIILPIPSSRVLAGPQNVTVRAKLIAKGFQSPQFTLPDGFEIELVAGPPLVHHPIMAGFDDRGRLFVSETAGLNLRNTELDQKLPNYITLLEDFDGDGLFDKSTRFADKMTFPQGGLWHQGALYVCSPPGVWRLEDTDGDGVADKREQLADGFVYTGNAADVHGPFLHPNGRLYWCHGRKGHEVYQRDGKTLVSKGKGARIWSMKPDGSDIQVHAGGGMDNPTELTITPEGEILGSVNLFYGRPRGDVLVHWQYGGAYPRHDQQAVVAEFKRTGDLLKEIYNFGHVAVSGLTHYRSTAFGRSYRDNIFITYFNTHKLAHVRMERAGAGFRADPEDFLEAHSNDVHFTDVLEDADGSLLVIDTGGWFRIGCPTSQIAKPEANGAIYRIRRKGAARPTDPRGLKIDSKQISSVKMTKLLDDERFAVRERATEELARRGTDETTATLGLCLIKGSERVRRSSVWILSRLGSDAAKAHLSNALADSSASVRQSACTALGGFANHLPVSKLRKLLRDNSLAVQREAAVALGRTGDKAAVPYLLQQIGRELPRPLEHAILYALIQLNEPKPLLASLKNPNGRHSARVLTVLDQLDAKPLAAKHVIPLLHHSSDELQETAIAVATRHPEWADAICEDFERSIFNDRHPQLRHIKTLAQLLPAYLSQSAGRNLLTRLIQWKDHPKMATEFAPLVIGASPGVKLEPDWIAPLRANLNSSSHEVVSRTVAALTTLKAVEFDSKLAEYGNDVGNPSLLRVKALAAISNKNGSMDAAAFGLTTGLLAPETPASDRGEAARLLGAARLVKAQLLTLAKRVSGAGPLELPELIHAFEKSRDKEVGIALVQSLEYAPGLANLSPDELKRFLLRYPPEVYQAAEPLVEKLLEQSRNQVTHLQQLEDALPKGDAVRGAQVFVSQKAVCSVCHQVAGKGGKVGPDLTQIGRIRTQRDLLEAIVYPSASLARDFEAYSIETTDGEAQTGVIFSSGNDVVQLAIANGQYQTIPRNRIKSILPSSLSLMPQGMDTVLTKQELADVVAYLHGLK